MRGSSFKTVQVMRGSLIFQNEIQPMGSTLFNLSSFTGLEKIKAEHKKWGLLDDHEVEIKYSGPSGYGIQGKAVGCSSLLNELQITESKFQALSKQVEALESHLVEAHNSRKDKDAEFDPTALLDAVSFFQKFALASKSPEYVNDLLLHSSYVLELTLFCQQAFLYEVDDETQRKHALRDRYGRV